jgi:hypothetical protein
MTGIRDKWVPVTTICPQVEEGGRGSNMEGSCEYIE